MEKKITKEQTEINQLKQQIAQRSGENLNSFRLIQTITVFNPNPNSKEKSKFEGGDLIMSTKTESGYDNQKIERPFTANILKVRMFLKTKKKFADKGVPFYISDEFDSYADNDIIKIKEKEGEKYNEVFSGNYKQVNEKYSIKGEFNAEKYLELNHVMYIVEDFEQGEVKKVLFKGSSRTKYFDYQNSFNRMDGEYMSTTWTIFDSALVTEDWQGNPLRFTVYSFDFKKGDELSLEELKKSAEMQKQLEMEIYEREEKFKKLDAPKSKEIEAPKKEEELPTIDLDEEDKQSTLDEVKQDNDVKIPELKKEDVEEEDEIKVSDLPF